MADVFRRSGKVRDLYGLPDGRLLLIASDRISAFDVVLPTPVPDKGKVLTGLSRFWFAETRGVVPNHLLDTDPAAVAGVDLDLPDGARAEAARGRLMVCQRTDVVPIEAVVRGYLAGSGWAEYGDRGAVAGIKLPPGLREADALPTPIFTPATKAATGAHDENIDFDGMVAHIAASGLVPEEAAGAVAEAIRDAALSLYRYAAAIAGRAGLLLADTKFEFGLGWGWAREDEPADAWDPTPERIERVRGRRPAGRRPSDRNWSRVPDQLVLIDEALTPDSSRFWDAAAYEPGRSQASFDKQFVRDYLEALDWDKTAPGPELPPDVVDGTRRRYIEAFERITGASFDRYLAEDVIAR